MDLSIFDSVEINSYVTKRISGKTYFCGKFDSKESLVKDLMEYHFDNDFKFYFEEFFEALITSVNVEKMYNFFGSYADYFEYFDGIFYVSTLKIKSI